MLSDWIDKWLEIGYECNRDGEAIPLRASIARFLAYRLHIGS